MQSENLGKCIVSDLGDSLFINTPGNYAMDVAIEILWYLEKEHEAEIFDSGWKRGYGLNVCEDYEIALENSILSINTDGSEATISRLSGKKHEALDVLKHLKQWIIENANSNI